MQTPVNTCRNSERWRVIHVRPRCEKKLAGYCARLGVEHYLPLRRETRVCQRRKVTVEKPLFNGYVFLRYGGMQRLDLLKSGQVVRILEVPDQDSFVSDILQIRRALCVDPSLSACRALAHGDRVRIESGPFEGLEGVVEAMRDGCKIVLNVATINRGVAVEVALDMIEKIA